MRLAVNGERLWVSRSKPSYCYSRRVEVFTGSFTLTKTRFYRILVRFRLFGSGYFYENTLENGLRTQVGANYDSNQFGWMNHSLAAKNYSMRFPKTAETKTYLAVPNHFAVNGTMTDYDNQQAKRGIVVSHHRSFLSLFTSLDCYPIKYSVDSRNSYSK